MENDQSSKPASDKTLPKSKKRRSTRTLLGFLSLLIVVGGALGAAYYYHNKYKQVWHDPEIVAKEESRHLTEQVGQLIQLPQDETPTIATVSDKEQLKEQPFFNNAKNGDKALLYTKAKKAFLYRPADNRIIEVAPIIDNANTAKPKT